MDFSVGSIQNSYDSFYKQGFNNSDIKLNNAAASPNQASLGALKTDDYGSLGVGAKKQVGSVECQTCKNRKYQDGSNDPGVSFKAPGYISPGASASVVMAHEQEHVRNETARAESSGRQVVSQSVTLQTSVCPECGRTYVSGGQTTTVTKGESSGKKDYFMENMQKSMNKYFGKALDVKV